MHFIVLRLTIGNGSGLDNCSGGIIGRIPSLSLQRLKGKKSTTIKDSLTIIRKRDPRKRISKTKPPQIWNIQRNW